MQTQKIHTLSIKNKIQPETTISSYKPNIWKYDDLLSLTTQYSVSIFKSHRLSKSKCIDIFMFDWSMFFYI